MSALVSQPPAPAPTPAWRFPSVARASLPGVDVLAAHLPARPLVHVTVLVGAGALSDPLDRAGTSSVLGEVVLRGAGGRDQHELAVAFERVGAVPGVTTRFERTELGVEAPTRLLGSSLALLAEVLRDPTLDPDQVVRVRDARVDRIRSRANDAGFRARRATTTALFADSSRFATPAGGDVASLGAVTPEVVREQHTSSWAAAPVALALTGDLTGIDLEQVARPLSIAATPPSPVTDPADLDPAGARIVVVDVPGAVQSTLRMIAPALPFGVGDDAGREVAQTAVLSSFSSRLNTRMREELGYTYGAGGGVTRLRDAGWMEAGCAVRTEVTADAVDQMVRVVRDAVADGLTDDEVEQARENLVRRFPVRYDGPGAVDAALVRRAHHGLPDDERDEHLRALRRVTTSSATSALREAVALDGLVVVVAGDAESVEPGLVDLDLGPVTRG